jgi:hypothetical protein
VSVETAGGVVLIAAPLWFNTTFCSTSASTTGHLATIHVPGPGSLPGGRLGSEPPVVGMLSGLLLIAGAVLLGQTLRFGGMLTLGVELIVRLLTEEVGS